MRYDPSELMTNAEFMELKNSSSAIFELMAERKLSFNETMDVLVFTIAAMTICVPQEHREHMIEEVYKKIRQNAVLNKVIPDSN